MTDESVVDENDSY